MKYKNEEEFNKINMFWKWVFNENFKDYFIWNSYLNFLVKPWETPLFMANVTFEPGCRNNWHIHHSKSGGWQMLICTAWEWLYWEEWKEVQELKPWKIINIPANVKHWHWAKKDSWFSHISVKIPWEETNNEWLEPVDNEYYSSV